MKTYEIYLKKYLNMIYKIVNNPRPNMHRLFNQEQVLHGLLYYASIEVTKKLFCSNTFEMTQDIVIYASRVFGIPTLR